MKKLMYLIIALFLSVPVFSGQMSTNTQNLKSLWHFNDGTGTALKEETNTNAGTAVNTAWVTGRFGPCLSFNGSSSKVTTVLTGAQLGFPQSQASGYPFTVGCWFNMHVDNNDQNVLFGVGYPVWNPTAWFAMAIESHVTHPKAGVPTLGIWGYPGIYQGDTTIQLDTWYFATVTSDGVGTGHIYLNGKDDGGSVTGWIPGINATGYTATWGTVTTYGTFFFNGMIDEGFVLNRCLSAAEVRRLYEESKSRHGGK